MLCWVKLFRVALCWVTLCQATLCGIWLWFAVRLVNSALTFVNLRVVLQSDIMLSVMEPNLDPPPPPSAPLLGTRGLYQPLLRRGGGRREGRWEVCIKFRKDFGLHWPQLRCSNQNDGHTERQIKRQMVGLKDTQTDWVYDLQEECQKNKKRLSDRQAGRQTYIQTDR
jgi:hypothetical protein